MVHLPISRLLFSHQQEMNVRKQAEVLTPWCNFPQNSKPSLHPNQSVSKDVAERFGAGVGGLLEDRGGLGGGISHKCF